MISVEERKTLVSFICNKLPSNPGLPHIIPFVGNEIAKQMPTVIYLSQMADWIIDQGLRQSTADVFVQILAAAEAIENPQFQPFLDMAEKLRQQPGLWQPSVAISGVDWNIERDPLDVAGKPFLDRLQFRQLLPRPASDNKMPLCTVIGGDRGNGKSYLAEYTKGFASRVKELKVACVNVADCGEGSEAIDNIATEIATSLDTDFAKRPRLVHEDEHRHARNVVSWIIQFTPARTLPSLVILDGFDEGNTAPAVHTLIEELLSTLLLNQQTCDKLRLLLLGYDISRLQDKALEHSVCILESIGIDELTRWYKARFPDRPDYQYEDAVTAVFTRLQAGRPRLRTLCNLVQSSQQYFL